MRIETIELTDRVLTVKCSGLYGVGSDGNPSALALTEAIEHWMSTHPDERIDELEIDYTEVEYSCGDGPVSSVIPFVGRGIGTIRLIASGKNRQPLEALVRVCRTPWITVGSRDA